MSLMGKRRDAPQARQGHSTAMGRDWRSHRHRQAIRADGALPGHQAPRATSRFSPVGTVLELFAKLGTIRSK